MNDFEIKIKISRHSLESVFDSNGIRHADYVKIDACDQVRTAIDKLILEMGKQDGMSQEELDRMEVLLKDDDD
ncbi:MAG TPA: hypothetical protein VD815_00975, partial [Candidatus Saccharimonadales bacterium]|nr:hypothetical protein [Candidatus Saccharimonadales bacterium]